MSTVEASGSGSVADLPIDAEVMGDGRLNRGGVAWSLFEGARNPYVILITIYIFMPYVAGVMVGDPVRGQEVISQWSQYAGWAVMLTAPLLSMFVVPAAFLLLRRRRPSGSPLSSPSQTQRRFL